MYESLSSTDMHYIIRRLPSDVQALLVQTPGLMVAGGFIRELIGRGEVRDIDICGSSANQLKIAADELLSRRNASGQRCKLHETKNAFTLLTDNRTPVQFISRWTFQTPHDCIASLDFTVCQAAIWFDQGTREWRSVCASGFYRDLAAKRLVYTAPDRNEDAGGSLLRVVKFAQRGYHIAPESLGRVMARVAIDVRWNEVQTEAHAARVFTGVLREVDPLHVIDGLELADDMDTPSANAPDLSGLA